MQFLACAVVCGTLISALDFIAPRATPATNAIELHSQGWTPKPTDPPKFNIELFKRQLTSSLTEIEGPDSICGYQFGSQYGTLGLCETSTCGFATALDQDGEIFCYDSTTSAPRHPWTSCLAGTLAISCLGDSACSDNPGIGLCTITSEPFCNVGTFIGLGVEAVWCDSTYYDNGSTISIYTTYEGQIGRVFTNPTSSGAVPTTISSIATSPTTNTPTSTSPSITPTIPTYTTQPKSTSIGPIVGGVVGGLALIAAIGFGMFLYLRRNRKHEQITNPPEIQTYSQGNNAESQQPFNKHLTTTTFIPAEYHPPSVQPQPQSFPTGVNRGSVVTSISAPGSSTPPIYIPPVPEMTGEASYHANPIDHRYKMST